MDKVSKGLAPLCATIVGVLTFVGWLPWWIAITMILVGSVALIASRLSLYFSPLFAAIVISLWLFTGIGLMAAVTAFLLWGTLHIPQLFTLPPETLKEVSAALTGALTTFAGVMLTKEMEEGGGFFWPGTQFKNALSAVFSKSPRVPAANSTKWEAVYNDRVHGGPRGWGFRARLRRATILTTL